MISAESDFRKILTRELEGRCRLNSNYSLRAFARDLGLAPSRLSEVLNGKQGLSKNSAKGVAAAMGFAGKEQELFCDLVESEHARSKLGRDLARIRLAKHKVDEEFVTLELDTFKMISEWYHFAILQMIELKGFRSDPAWIASTLGIRATEASLALKRLQRLQMIELRNGKIVALKNRTRLRDDIPSRVVRESHRKILKRAALALETQPVEAREFSANLFAIDQRDLPQAKKWLRSFRRRFAQRLSRAEDENKNHVYCLAIQFFNLTQGKEN